MSWFNTWVLNLLPAVLITLRINLESSPSSKTTWRRICVTVVKSGRIFSQIYADDPTFEEEVNSYKV